MRGPTYLTGGFPAPPELAVLEAFPGDGVTGRSILTVTGVLTQVAEKSHRARPWKSEVENQVKKHYHKWFIFCISIVYKGILCL